MFMLRAQRRRTVGALILSFASSGIESAFYDKRSLQHTCTNLFFIHIPSRFSFNSSLLNLWSSNWTAQNIARHNTNKK
jgi:hypothetical protein